MKNRIGALSLSALAVSSIFAVDSRPNILIINADDLDFDQMNVACYPREKFPSFTGADLTGNAPDYYVPEGWDPYHFSNAKLYTPNLDRLAAEGAHFNRFYATSTVCTPSRYSLLTGKYAHRSRAMCAEFSPDVPARMAWNQTLDGREENLAKRLSAAGYYTGMIGKWHNGEPEGIEFPKVYHKYKHDEVLLKQKLLDAQRRGCDFLREEIGFDYASNICFGDAGKIGGQNLPWYAEAVLDFLDTPREQPFFLYFALPVPHGVGGGARFERDLTLSPAGRLDAMPDAMPSIDDVYRRIRENGCSDRSITFTWLDDCVGAVLKKLEERGLDKNTIVLFTSDHQSRGKSSCYEGTRVPFLIRWPGKIEPGLALDDLWANIDVLPSMLELAGVETPADVDGRSFIQRITGKQAADPDRAILLEIGYTKAVVKGNFKYMANRPPQAVLDQMEQDKAEHASGFERTVAWNGQVSRGPFAQGVPFGVNQYFPDYFDADQLYDLESDLFEQANVADIQTQRVAELKLELKKLLRDCPNVFGEFTP